MPAAADVAEWLEDNGYGTVGTNIFIGWMPDSPDVCISVQQTGSWMPPELTINQEYPIVQVRVRHTSSSSAWTVANNILDDLHQLTDATIETRSYQRFDAANSPALAGRDPKDRTEYTINFNVIKQIE